MCLKQPDELYYKMNYFAQHEIAALFLKVVMKQTNLDHGGDTIVIMHASSTSLSAVLCVDRCQVGPG